jgi:hypothetical protein
VHLRYRGWERSWNEGGCEPKVLGPPVCEWQDRHSWSTRAQSSMFGLFEPWDWWQERQSPPEPVTCWNTNGPRDC